ncbi:MAG: flagellar motor switch protein FliG [Treponema sp.]|nr:flagellar motor switch protein FliG [Treponema sp.]
MYKKTISLKDTPKQILTEGFMKTGVKPGSIILESVKPQDSKYQRVAKFLILIGSEQAASILAELDPDQVSEISKEIALTKTILPDERDEILAEFHALFSRPYRFTGYSSGGIDTARRILYAAKGPEKGEALLNKAVPSSKTNLFSFLEDFSPEQIVLFLNDETDQTAALVLARLPSKLSAGALSKLPQNRKPGILKRIAHHGEVLPEVLEQVSIAFKEKVRHISGGAKDIKIDGMQTLAAILKQGDHSFGDRLINELEAEEPGIARNLKDRIYTIDDIIITDDRPIQEKLKTMTEIEIAILLKGRSIEFNEKILSNVSAGRRQLIREEYEILGPVPKHDCDAAARDFLAWFKLAREKGEIILYSDKDIFL